MQKLLLKIEKKKQNFSLKYLKLFPKIKMFLNTNDGKFIGS